MSGTLTVASGDNLWTIAKHKLGAGHRWPEIFALNRDKIKNPDLIRVGQQLTFPDAGPRGLYAPHPLQRHHPRIAQLSGTASHRPTADLGAPAAGAATGTDPVAATLVNNTAIKVDLNLLPPVTMLIPGGTAKLSWTGQVLLWRDGVRPLNTVGNKGLELSEKQHASKVLRDLIHSKKLTVGPNGVTYEDMMSVSSYGAPTTLVSSGMVVTSTSPFLSYRTQIKTTLRQGKVGGWLFRAHDMTMNFDISLDPQGRPPAQPPLPQTVPAPAVQAPRPAPALSPASRITADTGAAPHPSALDGAVQWTSDHKEAIAATALIVGTVALGVLTLGSSTALEALGLAALRFAPAAIAGARVLATAPARVPGS